MIEPTRDWIQIYQRLDLPKVAVVAREVVNLLLSARTEQGRKRTYADVAHLVETEVPENALEGSPPTGAAIKTFTARDSVSRINKHNKTLEALYAFLMAVDRDRLPEQVASYLSSPAVAQVLTGSGTLAASPDKQQRDELTPLARDMATWLEVGVSEIDRAAAIFTGRYALLRQSYRRRGEDEPVYVKSELDVTYDQFRHAIHVTHTHIDGERVQRVSRGFAIPQRNTISVLLNVEQGEGFEVITLRIPIQKQYKKMLGIMNTMTMSREPIAAPIVLVRDAADWSLLQPRFVLSRLHDARPDDVEMLTGLLSAPLRMPQRDPVG